MDVVVPCECGARFTFQIDNVPEGGKLPDNAELACPSCGKDGVDAANQAMAAMLAPPPAAALPPINLPPPAEEKKRSWFSKKKKEEEDDDFDGEDQVYTGPNLTKGRIAATTAAIVGTLIWFAIIHFTHKEIRFVAVVIGALIGYSARKIGGGRDYHLGLFAGACACAAILFGQILGTRSELVLECAEKAEDTFVERMGFAKDAVATTNDLEFPLLLALERTTLFAPVLPQSITPQEIEHFKTNDLPNLQKFVAGEPSREQFVSALRQEYVSKLTARDIFNDSLSPYIFLWLFLGTATAWKLASDYGTSVDVS